MTGASTTVPDDLDTDGTHRPRGRRHVIVVLVVTTVLITFVLAVGPRRSDDWTPTPSAELAAAEDAMHRKVRAELRVFTDWLETNDADGYIGEIGIPQDRDGDAWNTLAEVWYRDAEAAGLWVDVWSTGEWWGEGYEYLPYFQQGGEGPVSAERRTGQLLSWQARHSRHPRGVNVSGGEFGAPGGTDSVTDFSNVSPGTYDRDWHYDTQATFDYLASRGLRTVRLPFRWERIQPALGEPLDPSELLRLKAAVGRADNAGLSVILDLHNFGAYHLYNGEHGVRRAIGSAEVTRGHFAELWRNLSLAFRDVQGVAAYDLMNEPVDLPSEQGLGPAQVWELATQEALDAVRSTGDDMLVMVPGYRWSHAFDWPEQHPTAWIVDPAENFRYAAHHYWQLDGAKPYAREVAEAERQGH